MELKDIWWWYCEQRFPDIDMPPPKPISPHDALSLLFDLFPMFTARSDIIDATRYNTSYDAEADAALAYLAQHNSFAAWDQMSAGAWRIINERLIYTAVVFAANEAARNPVIAHHPIGLDRQSSARALMLEFLLGGARIIDRKLLREKPDGSLPEFPASTIVRPQ